MQTVPADPFPCEHEAKEEAKEGRRVCKRPLILWQLWSSNICDVPDDSWTICAQLRGAGYLSFIAILAPFRRESRFLLVHGKNVSEQLICIERHGARRLHAAVMPLLTAQVLSVSPVHVGSLCYASAGVGAVACPSC